MSRNGSGIYNLPTGNPVVTGTTITSNWANTTLSDISTALTGSVASDGQTPITGNLQMGGNLITGLGTPVSTTDGANKGYVDTALAALVTVPSGSIFMWPTASSPTGWLICNGSAVSRTTYAALYAIIGTTFGVGDGSTTFNLPNYTNRMPYGTTIGATGGTADAVVVSHTHTITDPGHQHNTSVTGHLLFDYNGAETVNYGGGGTYPGTTFSMSNNTTGISVNTAGVSGTNQNLPPYLGINFIIKV